jgi:flagellar basal body-associated protein FliL
MAIREILKENQPEVYKHLKDKYKLKEEVKNKNNEKLSEEDIKKLMGSRRYKRINGAMRQV